MKFPWNIVDGWEVASLANGSVLITPKYAKGCPGVITRMRLALWISDRLMMRRKRASNGASDALSERL